MSLETAVSNNNLITANTEQIVTNQNLVYEAGQKAEYDKFWDAYQCNGTRVNYENAFNGYGFDANNFYPKYDIRPTGWGGDKIFYAWSQSLSRKTFSLKERLKECGVVLDTSQAVSLSSAFNFDTIHTELPTIDLTGLTQTSGSLFANNYGTLHTIEKIIIAETTPISANWFGSLCQGLENLTIEGTIGQNNFNVQYQTKLSGASIVSIIEALSSTTSGLTVTLSQTAVDSMTFPITSEQTGTTYNSWTELEETKTNWTIALA